MKITNYEVLQEAANSLSLAIKRRLVPQGTTVGELAEILATNYKKQGHTIIDGSLNFVDEDSQNKG